MEPILLSGVLPRPTANGALALAFSIDLIDEIEQSLSSIRQRHLGATSAVLQYAPRRLRADASDAAKAQADIAYWRERAFKAETRLRALETRVQSLAARSRPHFASHQAGLLPAADGEQ